MKQDRKFDIRIEALTRRFGENVAVDRLTFAVRPGEVFGLLGHNGAGKTTTIRLLNGVLGASDGQAEVLGLDPMREGSELRRQTGVLTENPSLDENLTANENLRIYARLYDVPAAAIEARVATLLDQFKLTDRADDKTGSYSKGMKQRLALARALLHQPRLLFLDEPTSGLDPVAAHEVRQLILKLSRSEGRTVLLCTHNLVEAQRLCDRVIILEQGKLLALGKPAELSARIGGTPSVEIEVSMDTFDLAVSKLTEMSGAHEIARVQETIQLSGVERQHIPEVISILTSAGVRIFKVIPEEPTREDVYFSLHASEQESAL